MRAYTEESGNHGWYDRGDEKCFDLREHVERLRWWYHNERTSPNPREWVLPQRRAELARHDEKP